jgi:hypothetical protein
LQVGRPRQELELIEEKTGFSDFISTADNEAWDYRSEIQRLGSLTHRFAYDQVRISNAELTNRFLYQQLKSIKKWVSSQTSQNAIPRNESATLLEHVDFSFSSIQHLKQYQSLEKRLQSRQDVVSPLFILHPATAILTEREPRNLNLKTSCSISSINKTAHLTSRSLLLLSKTAMQ